MNKLKLVRKCDKRRVVLERAETRDHDEVEEIEVREPGGDLERYITTEGFERVVVEEGKARIWSCLMLAWEDG